MSEDRVVGGGKVKAGFISKVPMLLSVKICSPVPERMGLQLVEVTSTEYSLQVWFLLEVRASLGQRSVWKPDHIHSWWISCTCFLPDFALDRSKANTTTKGKKEENLNLLFCIQIKNLPAHHPEIWGVERMLKPCLRN